MKRIYKTVSVVPAPEGFGILLDARPLKTPAKRALVLPRILAEAVAAEWQGQGETVQPVTMPCMRLAATAIDRVAERRDEVVEAAAAFAATDLLCYRAEAPAELVERQAALWQPLLDWAMLRFDAPLMVSTGIMPQAQPADSLNALRHAVAGLDLLTLTALADLAGLAGSLVLALAVLERRLTGQEAAELVLLEETYQVERWGEDEEAAEHRAGLIREIEAVARFLRLLSPEGERP
jgi:chaperone required for assembly of F1-ATPase